MEQQTKIKWQSPTDSIFLDEILTKEALNFLAYLHHTFNQRRLELLAKRETRLEAIKAGQKLHFLPETAKIRQEDWKVASTPKDLEDRRVEITGPTDAKMMINALNSGAKVFMADLEDASSPTWHNVLEAQLNLKKAVRHELNYIDTQKDKSYQLKKPEELATLIVRPRGWHLPEKHLLINDEEISGSLFDFGLYLFHNAKERLERGTGPYFYLPKMESHLEARLWNEVFVAAQDYLDIPQGSIRATCLIETILAAYEMEEILYELKDHASGLNAGRWDYIFSIIKTFQNDPSALLPDRKLVTMNAPFMKAYTNLLIQTCHRRGAHAIGGMAAFIPSRKDKKANEIAFTQVRADKEQEAKAGCDGTWVAHPDLVPVAKEIFSKAFGKHCHQKHILHEELSIREGDLCSFKLDDMRITEDGVRSNIGIAIQYMDYWLNGLGAVALHNLMEDAATAEISRAQLWQWLHFEAQLEDGRKVSPELYRKLRNEELEKLGGLEKSRYAQVIEILDGLVLSQEFTPFLTLPAYRLI